MKCKFLKISLSLFFLPQIFKNGDVVFAKSSISYASKKTSGT